MSYRVELQTIIKFDIIWFKEHLGGPIKSIPFGIKGPNWVIQYSTKFFENNKWVTLGEFDNEEDAILFELTWS